MVLKPTRAGLTRAGKLLRSGGVIAFPTDTVYGLGAAADDEVACRRIFAIKGRPVGLPLILMAAAESQLEGWVHVDSRAEDFIRRFWPGPLTVILHAKGGGTLGVRIPKHEVTLELLRAAGPLMTTSANLRQRAGHERRRGGVSGRGGGDPRRWPCSRRCGLERSRPHRPGTPRSPRGRDLDRVPPWPSATPRWLGLTIRTWPHPSRR